MNSQLIIALLTSAAAACAANAAEPAKEAGTKHHAPHHAHAATHSSATQPGTAQDALDRQHAQVAATRDAEQQRLIASGLRSGQLNAAQASELEHAQAAIVAAQADLEHKGHETVDDALRMQHLQDVQDWAIRSGHEPTSARA